MSDNINLSIKELYTPIYRIVEFDRFVSMLESSENCLTRPALWDDPFEDILHFTQQHGKIRFSDSPANYFGSYVFAQCWTFLEENDLMWRVYSPDKDGIKLKSTPHKLLNSLNNSKKISKIINEPEVIDYIYKPEAIDEHNGTPIQEVEEDIYEELKVFIGKVEYFTLDEIAQYLKGITGKSPIEDLVKSVFIKREPFKNEEEVRVGIYYFNAVFSGLYERVNYDININEFIDEVVFDPRISYYKYKGLSKLLLDMGYTNPIKRSTIYDIP